MAYFNPAVPCSRYLERGTWNRERSNIIFTVNLRRMSVGGSWYPRQAATLAADVERYLEAADLKPASQRPLALIAPHAGLMYSGPVAAFAYKLARDAAYQVIVLVGPSHFVPFRGVSLWSQGAWETPFGGVAVDRELAATIRRESDEIVELETAHGREHSLEMQLPFVAHLWPGVPIVPLVMGHQTRETAVALGDALARAVQTRRESTLLVASSDLSHYEDALTAAELDAVVIRHVETLDPEGLMATLEHEPRHACGGGPIVSVLRAARMLGASDARLLRYADSGDVSGDKSSVVGYMAAAIW
jgi:AmmeMemoRadiSam system protein B